MNEIIERAKRSSKRLIAILIEWYREFKVTVFEKVNTIKAKRRLAEEVRKQMELAEQTSAFLEALSHKIKKAQKVKQKVYAYA